MNYMTMEESKTLNELNPLVGRMSLIYENLEIAGDTFNSQKLYQLIDKLMNQEYTIAFCGHFSAGKSSMINALMGEGILPSSPIPTSANLVKVKSGLPYARVKMKDKGIIQFEYPYDIEKIKRFCIDGDMVENVEISHPSTQLPAHVSIMDTPGVDSTDDAHRVSTESALHLADLVVYVMDYNHVQSELNFSFTKQLSERNKPLLLIINQMDKHQEQEISLIQYKQDVERAFAQWDVHPIGIFYTSLKNIHTLENDFNKVKIKLSELISNKDELIYQNAIEATKGLILEHGKWLEDHHNQELEPLMNQLNDLSIDQLKAVSDEYQNALLLQMELVQRDELFENKFMMEMGKILTNANLTPFETRELAKLFLESVQPDFKIGFLFSGKKTEQEKENRLNRFLLHLEERAHTQLDWHLKNLLLTLTKENGLHDQEFMEKINNSSIKLDPEILNRSIKKGATLNGDYVLNYAKEISDSIRQLYRTFYSTLMHIAKELIKQQTSRELNQLTDQTKQLEAQHLAIVELEKAKYHVAECVNKLNQLLTEDLERDVWISATDRLPIRSEDRFIEYRESSPQQNTEFPKNYDIDVEPVGSKIEPITNFREQLQQMATVLNKAALQINSLIGFQIEHRALLEKSKRLENSQFTVALFGAFSAGKSSFANALLGKQLLPTSPNPTTATITKILPPSSKCKHGTVRIKIKSRDDLLQDLKASLTYFNVKIMNVDEALNLIPTIKASDLRLKEKSHYNYLQAILSGYPRFVESLGETIETDLSQFEEFVVKENHAVFIEWMEIYYSCPLTEQGIMIVDTPGADSINSRHTGVAFEYIKNADAVIFVTYYNHAFSQADRQFLLQLGRVKESFELDKMFFIINAVDLAHSTEEVLLVQKHVEKNLLECGIRYPRIYPVSSKVALLEKLSFEHSEKDGVHSGIQSFEYDFQSYAMTELVQTSIQAAKSDIQRVIQKVKEFIEASNENELHRKKKMDETKQMLQEAKALVLKWEISTLEIGVKQELVELIYYVRHRFFLRFRDTFKLFFNPASLREDHRKIKYLLRSSLDELIQFMRTDLEQEMRATSLRMENYLFKQLDQFFIHIQDDLLSIDASNKVIPYQKTELSTPEVEKGFQQIDANPLLPVLELYKNPKQFYEQGGSVKMAEELEKFLHEPISRALNYYLEEFGAYYFNVLSHLFNEMKLHINEQIIEFYDGKMASLTMKFNPVLLQNIYVELQNLIK